MKKMVLLLFIALSAGAAVTLLGGRAVAQSYVFNRAQFPVGTSPDAVAAGDFNGDGLLDLVTSNDLSANFSVLLAKPDGTFETHVDYSTGVFPTYVVVGDFNADGKLDLAVGIGSSTTVSIFLGKGDGRFGKSHDFQAGTSNPSILRVTDLNHDGKLDLVVSHNNSNQVSVLLGRGDGTFPSHVDYTTDPNPIGVVVGDFNGDQKLDLAVACANGLSISLLLGNGDGTLQPQVSIGSVLAPIDIATADFNGDKKLDLVVNGSVDSGGGLQVFLGNGDGTFQALSETAFGFYMNSLVAGDVNQDGKADVVAAAGQVAVFLGNGDGTFQTVQSYGAPDSATKVVLADFNRDGALDAATADIENNSGFTSVLMGNGDGSFVTRSILAPGLSNPIGIVAADFNGDGHPDLAVLDNGLAGVLVQLGNGDGTFQSATTYDTAISATSLVSGDLNEDGSPDLVTTNLSSSNISVLIANGDGTFRNHTEVMTAAFPTRAALADFNGDGKTDIAVTVSTGVSILLGNGDGTFGRHVEYPTGSGPLGIGVGDFNGDGKIDLAVANGNANTVSVLLGNGDGSFQFHQDFASVFGPEYMTVGDFNGDGILDLAINSYSSSQVSVMLGSANGTFPTHVEYLTGFGPFDLISGDFTGDGIVDLATVDSGFTNFATVSLFAGVGDGTFESRLDLLDGGRGGIAFATSDVDENGSLDVAVVNRIDLNISVLLNTPLVAFSPALFQFPVQTVGTKSAPKKLTISNPSAAPLKLQSLRLGGADPHDFVDSTHCAKSLMPGKNCTVQISFDPTAKGVRSAALNVQDDAPNRQQHISLSGTGTVVALSPVSVDFGNQQVGTVSVPQSVTVTNTGSSPLSISSVSIVGLNTLDFAIQQNGCGSTLSGGGKCTISIVFQPSAAGNRSAVLAISDNGGGSPQKVSLTGVGI